MDDSCYRMRADNPNNAPGGVPPAPSQISLATACLPQDQLDALDRQREVLAARCDLPEEVAVRQAAKELVDGFTVLDTTVNKALFSSMHHQRHANAKSRELFNDRDSTRLRG